MTSIKAIIATAVPRAETVLQVTLGALVMLAATFIRIPVPFSTIPATLQALVALYLGLKLGKVKGASAALLPFLFTPYLLAGPTAGYIIGFGVMAYLMGAFTEGRVLGKMTVFGLALIVSALQLLMGASYLSAFIGVEQAWITGVLPFVLTAVCKAFLVSFAAPARA